MKKLFLLFAVATMSLSIYSCRETTEENVENDMEEIGDDIEESAEEAGEDIERTAEEAGNEVEAEVEGTDDM
ncbi:hypothetical protein [Autumnicola edwardsiae]|jgi:predicted small secreted protein|uniref:Uncharacterized protein n=1 Tax=Autumnicola edwardsiae TaxID=3075594 RepID=A0ABU3CTL7_9FLAO|nr:hypothetical protein [Zunongwangia sp. F297]MDT0649704.1 hypothetical protein [Zunongwangia sp. F297]